MTIDFDGKVAIVTGAGNGLGRSHAIELASRGAKVVVNDLGGSVSGEGSSSMAAQKTANLIKEAGGEAVVSVSNVTQFAQVESMVDETLNQWGRVDILVNNAGILRDKSFSNMDIEDFREVIDVHLMGSVNCCKAVWNVMCAQKYGRIVMTSSSSGLYGNFGQSNYSTAKMALIGLMNTLVLEGKKHNIKVNALVPAAITRMTERIITDKNALALMTPEVVSSALLTLCHQSAPNRTILCAGSGAYSTTHIMSTDALYLPEDEQTPEKIIENWDCITDINTVKILDNGTQHIEALISKAKPKNSNS